MLAILKNLLYYNECNEARWSSGQDVALSRRKQRFDSATGCYFITKNIIWPVGQAVKTSPSHGENSGSIPLRAVAYKSTKTKYYGSLVKRLRRRPLTAKTAVRFRYELLTVKTAQPLEKH